MKHSTDNQQAIVNILLRSWEEIFALEQQYSLLVGKGDMRPRVEYFHDAIRAFTAGTNQERLAIERLAYDVRCLRYLATMPLASITHDATNLSPKTLPAVIAPGLVDTSKRIQREAKDRLSELYTQYGMLFASLLKVTAEKDYQERTNELNQEVEEINQLIHAISSNASTQEITALMQHLSNETLKRDLLLMLPQIRGKSVGALNALIAKLQANIQKNDKRIKGIDHAHHDYATSQLAIYENAKDMLKEMAKQGMNLVGQFVESALRGAGTQRTRGR